MQESSESTSDGPCAGKQQHVIEDKKSAKKMSAADVKPYALASSKEMGR